MGRHDEERLLLEGRLVEFVGYGRCIWVFCSVRIHQIRKSLSSLAANVKNFDGKLLGKVRNPMKARCYILFEEPGANHANPYGITIIIMKDNCDVMNAVNTGLGDNSIPKVFYTSNWVHNEPLKAANENPNAPHVDSSMGRFMDVNHVGLNANVANVVDRTTRSGCIKSGVNTDKPVQNITTNPKVALNKLLNKESVQVAIDVESNGAQSFDYFCPSLTVDFLWFLKGMGKRTMKLEQEWGVNKKVGVDGCCKGVNICHDDTSMGHSKSVKAKDRLCTNMDGVMVEMEQPGTTCRMVLGSYEPVTHGRIMNEGGNVCLGMSKLGSSASYSGRIPTGLVDKSPDSTCADI
nr:hypothetical protein [Tanacetum cinerariifolium]